MSVLKNNPEIKNIVELWECDYNKMLKTNIEFDQLIREFDSWVHISIPNKFADKPRKQVLIIDKAGTRPY